MADARGKTSEYDDLLSWIILTGYQEHFWFPKWAHWVSITSTQQNITTWLKRHTDNSNVYEGNILRPRDTFNMVAKDVYGWGNYEKKVWGMIQEQVELGILQTVQGEFWYFVLKFNFHVFFMDSVLRPQLLKYCCLRRSEKAQWQMR